MVARAAATSLCSAVRVVTSTLPMSVPPVGLVFVFLYEFFFFLMMRLPPRSTLFPFPTLFRSISPDTSPAQTSPPCTSGRCSQLVSYQRSEEHTSELQSPYVISYALLCLQK